MSLLAESDFLDDGKLMTYDEKRGSDYLRLSLITYLKANMMMKFPTTLEQRSLLQHLLRVAREFLHKSVKSN
jgi:hypothetical protein